MGEKAEASVVEADVIQEVLILAAPDALRLFRVAVLRKSRCEA